MMNKTQLNELIDSKIDEIFFEYQKANGIESGDIFPEEYLKLEEIKDKLSDFVVKSMSHNLSPITNCFFDYTYSLVILLSDYHNRTNTIE